MHRLRSCLLVLFLVIPRYAAGQPPQARDGVPALLEQPGALRATLTQAQIAPLTYRFWIREYSNQTGEQVRFFDRDMTKTLHLIIVDGSLQTFMHVHPRLDNSGTFTITQRLPHGGTWHLYADGIPHNFGRAVFRFDVAVAASSVIPRPNPSVIPRPKDRGTTYRVVLQTQRLKAGALTMVGVTIYKGPHVAMDLRPYLGARAHAVMIGENLSYVHAHAMSAAMSAMPGMVMNAPTPLPSEDPCNNDDATMGMSLVELTPSTHVDGRMSIMLRPPSPGHYRLWLQFRTPQGVETAAFPIVGI